MRKTRGRTNIKDYLSFEKFLADFAQLNLIYGDFMPIQSIYWRFTVFWINHTARPRTAPHSENVIVPKSA